MKSTKVYLDHCTFALGTKKYSVEEAVNLKNTLSQAEVLRQAGFNQHFICEPDVNSYSLAAQALRPISPHVVDTDVIIYANCLPLNANVGDAKLFQSTRDVKYLMDFPASRLQAEFEMKKAIAVGLTQQACTGMLGGLRLAKMFLNTESDLNKILCVTADRFPEGAVYEQAYNLISDGAAACIISRDPQGFELLACHQVTNGSMAAASDDETVGQYFSYSHQVILKTLVKAGISLNEIAYIVPQNTNLAAWQILARLLKFDFERVLFPTLGEVGHCISGDNIINLKNLNDGGRLKGGDKILLLMAGYGLNWQAVILEKV